MKGIDKATALSEVCISKSGFDIPIPSYGEASEIVVAPTAEDSSALGDVAVVVLATDTRRVRVSVTRSAYDKKYESELEEAQSFEKQRKEALAELPEGERAVYPRPLQTLHGTPLVRCVVDTCTSAGAADVAVLVDAFPEEIGKALEGSFARMVAWDADFAAAEDARSGKFMLSHLSLGQFSSCLRAIGDGESEYVLIAMADQPQIEPRHLSKIMREARAHADSHVLTTYAEWRTGSPTLIRRTYLEQLCATDFESEMEGRTDQPIRMLPIREVVMGDDKLFAWHIFPEGYDTFAKPFGNRSALELAREARSLGEKREKDGAVPDDADKLAARALGFLDEIDAAVAGTSGDLSRWDAWAHRNKIDFPMLAAGGHESKLVYLDTAATSQQPYQALDAYDGFVRTYNANVYRGLYEASDRSTTEYARARHKVASFIGSKDWQVIFTSNTSNSCSIVARTWGDANVSKGDVIVVLASEHHSNMMPWRALAMRKGARIEYVFPDADGRVDRASFARCMQLRPKLVCLAHVSNVLGIVNPVRGLADEAHAAGARVFLDAAQSTPHMRIDVAELGVDFAGFSSHKVYGPMGIGALWVSEDVVAEMQPFETGGGTVSHVGLDAQYLRRYPFGFESGTPAIGAAIGFGAAVDYLAALGFDAIEEHSRVMTKYLVAALRTVPGIVVWGDHSQEDGACGLVCFSVFKTGCVPITQTLAKLGIAMRASTHCSIPLISKMGSIGLIRASLGLYNTKEDIDALVVALRLIVEHFEGSESRA